MVLPLAALSSEFVLPTNNDLGVAAPGLSGDHNCTYLCGNSLGPLSKRAESLIQEQIQVWRTHAVNGHFSHPHRREWVNLCDHVTPLLAEIVGAGEKEVACMGTLTSNLHLMMNSFYKPTPERFKILCEAKAFPSDQYAFQSQALAHGLDPTTAILEISPRQGEYTLREEDILDVIAREGSSIALVLFSGVQYYTGQWFPMQSITRKAKEQVTDKVPLITSTLDSLTRFPFPRLTLPVDFNGCICGWDLAHAVGNVPLSLHDWDVDFAVWCTYKYLNSGPGGIAGLYIHEKWNEIQKPKFAGWWGHEPSTRFVMSPKFSPILGAQGFQQSNPSVLAVASLLGSLQIFKEAGMMHPLRERSLQLTAALEELLEKSKYFVPLDQVATRYPPQGNGTGDPNRNPAFSIITPREPESRGAQLSLLFLPTGTDVMRQVFVALSSRGVIGDEREPDVIRLAPAPLYSSLEDCQRAALYLDEAFDALYTDKL